MGGRGAFKNIDSKDFTFVEGGQTYVKVGEVAGVEVLIRKGKLSVKAPEYSHSASKDANIILGRKYTISYFPPSS